MHDMTCFASDTVKRAFASFFLNFDICVGSTQRICLYLRGSLLDYMEFFQFHVSKSNTCIDVAKLNVVVVFHCRYICARKNTSKY